MPIVMRKEPITDEERKEARERLKTVLPHLIIAANMAELTVPGGTIKLGILAEAPGGGGRVAASFEGAEFIRDLEVLVGPLVEIPRRAVDPNHKPEARNLCICCDCNGHEVVTGSPNAEELGRCRACKRTQAEIEEFERDSG